MTDLLVSHTITCPHCWESISVLVDLSVPDQSYIEDCSVCCRSIAISVSVAEGELAELTAEAAD